MRKEIDYSGFNFAKITFYYKEVEAIRCNLLHIDEQGDIINMEKDIVFKKEYYPFELTVEEKEELIKMYYGDETTLLVE